MSKGGVSVAGNYVLGDGGSVSMSHDAVTKLLGAASGDAALLYIYILSCGGRFDAADAAGAIHRSAGQVESAMDVLARLGLVTAPGEAGAGKPLERPEELPEYTAEEIAREAQNGSTFSTLVKNVQTDLGCTLSSEGLKTLFGIYDYLRLDPEVIMMLVSWCKKEYQLRYGDSRRVSMRFIEKMAYVWEREGIFSFDAAMSYLKRQQDLRGGERAFMEAMDLTGRNLSQTEKRYIDSWLDMGFSPQAAAMAYDRTVVKTGRLTWRYMDSIMKSWHAKGLHTRREIEEKDAPPEKRPQQRRPNAEKAAGRAKLTARELDELDAALRLVEGERK